MLLTTQLKIVGSLLGYPKSSKSVKTYMSDFEKRIHARGINNTLVLYKYYYDVVKSLCLKTGIPGIPGGYWIKTDNKGIPLFIKLVIRQSNIDVNHINGMRFILTIFSTYELGK
jgi:hypothetical protein